ncbi:MAG: hypothetical protein LBQ07_00770 [Endomicrobium sp.]|nr:hypothetical protein [Endomicrobium sp.]
MLYYIFNYFNNTSSSYLFSILQQPIFRAIGAALISFLVCFVVCPYIIKKLNKFNVIQTIRIDGPSTHLIKNGTPTMGGVVILLAVIISVFLWTKLNNKFIICLIIGTVCFGLLGFYDDYLKFKKKSQQDFL